MKFIAVIFNGFTNQIDARRARHLIISQLFYNVVLIYLWSHLLQWPQLIVQMGSNFISNDYPDSFAFWIFRITL